MDTAAHYRHLIALGREEFLAASAPAALVRNPARALVGFGDDVTLDHGAIKQALAAAVQDALRPDRPGEAPLEIFPLLKKPGASFPDRITIGRTHNNDIVIGDHSVSRLHAYVRLLSTGWVVADAGSKNGAWLEGEALEPRRERGLPSKAMLRLGEIDLTFYAASDLYDALGGL